MNFFKSLQAARALARVAKNVNELSSKIESLGFGRGELKSMEVMYLIIGPPLYERPLDNTVSQPKK